MGKNGSALFYFKCAHNFSSIQLQPDHINTAEVSITSCGQPMVGSSGTVNLHKMAYLQVSNVALFVYLFKVYAR